MSERVVRMDAACYPAANRAAYSASPALATTQDARYYRGENVDRAVDSGWIVVFSKEEDSSGDGSRVGTTQV
jgi:hypothetical protein